MASINTIVKRKQYLWLGIVVVGTASAIGGALYLSDVDMSGNGETVAEQEPVPDMTGVVDTTFDDKVRQHATTEMQVTAAQMQKQYEEIRRELDVLNKQRGDDQRRIEKLGQDNAALAEQVKALGANPVTATGEPVPQMPASPPGPEGEPQPGNTPVSFPPQGSVAGRPCDDGADRWPGVLCREIITPFLARGFFPDFLRLPSGCAGRSGTVKGVVSLTVKDDSSEAEHSMTEQKRPVLTLKRKTEGETPVRSRKTIINVTTPPKWKVKKQKLAEKAAREAELAAKKAQARQALSIYLNLPSLDEAVNTLKPWWPGLFDGDTPRLLACGIRDVLLEDVAQRNIPLSHKKLRRALKAITRSESYLCAMKAGACRYDTEGYVTEHISQEEEAYAAERLDKIRRQNRIKAELQAVLDEK